MISFPGSFTFISDEVSQDLPAVVAFARRHRFRGFELRSMFGRAFRDLTPADLRDIAQAARDAGLAVVGCATPVFKCRLENEAEIREHRDLFQRSVEASRALGAPLLRIFSFLRRERRSSDGDLARAAAELNGLRALAAGGGLTIGIENEASCLAGTVDETRRLWRAGLAADFGLIWDPCNTLYVPGYAGAATGNFNELEARIVHVHVKDAARIPGKEPQARPVGEGEVGWRDHFRALASGGYSGWLSLETHWRPSALSAAELHLPGGFGFSAGGEEATERCLANLSAWFAGP